MTHSVQPRGQVAHDPSLAEVMAAESAHDPRCDPVDCRVPGHLHRQPVEKVQALGFGTAWGLVPAGDDPRRQQLEALSDMERQINEEIVARARIAFEKAHRPVRWHLNKNIVEDAIKLAEVLRGKPARFAIFDEWGPKPRDQRPWRRRIAVWLSDLFLALAYRLDPP